MPRLAIATLAALVSSSVLAADYAYPPPIVRSVPRDGRWVTPPPPPPVVERDVEGAPLPTSPVIEPGERFVEDLPPLVEPRVTRERRTEDRTVTEERFVSPPVVERYTALPDIVVTPAPVQEVPLAPPPSPPCAPAVVVGLAEAPWSGAPVEGLALRTGPGVEFQQLAHMFNGQPLLVCAREGNWFAVETGGLRGWAYAGWIRSAP